MLEHEYRQKIDAVNNKRDWLLTIIVGGFALLAWSGIFAVWKFIGHDGYIIVSVIAPLGLLAVILSLAALHGSRRVIKDAASAIFDLIYFWP